jgi:hypothetical protein
MRSAYVPLPARIAPIRIVQAISDRSSVRLIGGNLRLFLAGVGNPPAPAKKIAIPRMPEPAHQAEVSSRKSVPGS